MPTRETSDPVRERAVRLGESEEVRSPVGRQRPGRSRQGDREGHTGRQPVPENSTEYAVWVKTTITVAPDPVTPTDPEADGGVVAGDRADGVAVGSVRLRERDAPRRRAQRAPCSVTDQRVPEGSPDSVKPTG